MQILVGIFSIIFKSCLVLSVLTELTAFLYSRPRTCADENRKSSDSSGNRITHVGIPILTKQLIYNKLYYLPDLHLNTDRSFSLSDSDSATDKWTRDQLDSCFLNFTRTRADVYILEICWAAGPLVK